MGTTEHLDIDAEKPTPQEKQEARMAEIELMADVRDRNKGREDSCWDVFRLIDEHRVNAYLERRD